ncbi:MAG: (2Fe-2S) ferredoxin [Myxococcota bacterium]|jgi:(2Fe-2S) ferredoxin
MTKPDNILFVCSNSRGADGRESCGSSHDSPKLCQLLKDEVKARGLKATLRVTSSGCLGPCYDGPHAVLMPNDQWFSGFGAADCSSIIDAVQKKISKE